MNLKRFIVVVRLQVEADCADNAVDYLHEALQMDLDENVIIESIGVANATDEGKPKGTGRSLR